MLHYDQINVCRSTGLAACSPSLLVWYGAATGWFASTSLCVCYLVRLRHIKAWVRRSHVLHVHAPWCFSVVVDDEAAPDPVIPPLGLPRTQSAPCCRSLDSSTLIVADALPPAPEDLPVHHKRTSRRPEQATWSHPYAGPFTLAAREALSAANTPLPSPPSKPSLLRPQSSCCALPSLRSSRGGVQHAGTAARSSPWNW